MSKLNDLKVEIVLQVTTKAFKSLDWDEALQYIDFVKSAVLEKGLNEQDLRDLMKESLAEESFRLLTDQSQTKGTPAFMVKYQSRLGGPRPQFSLSGTPPSSPSKSAAPTPSASTFMSTNQQMELENKALLVVKGFRWFDRARKLQSAQGLLEMDAAFATDSFPKENWTLLVRTWLSKSRDDGIGLNWFSISKFASYDDFKLQIRKKFDLPDDEQSKLVLVSTIQRKENQGNNEAFAYSFAATLHGWNIDLSDGASSKYSHFLINQLQPDLFRQIVLKDSGSKSMQEVLDLISKTQKENSFLEHLLSESQERSSHRTPMNTKDSKKTESDKKQYHKKKDGPQTSPNKRSDGSKDVKNVKEIKHFNSSYSFVAPLSSQSNVDVFIEDRFTKKLIVCGHEAICKIDSGGLRDSLIHYEFVQVHHLLKKPLDFPVTITGYGGGKRRINWYVDVTIGEGSHKVSGRALVTDVMSEFKVDFLLSGSLLLEVFPQFDISESLEENRKSSPTLSNHLRDDKKDSIKFTEQQLFDKLVKDWRKEFPSASDSLWSKLIECASNTKESLIPPLELEFNEEFTDDQKPWPVRRWSTSIGILKRMKSIVEEWKGKGIVSVVPKESRSGFESNLVPVLQGDKIRPCLNLVELNKRIKDAPVVSLPKIQDILARIGKPWRITQLDLKHCYLQCPLAAEYKQYTCFFFEGDWYVFNRIPFGVKIAPAYVQDNMENLLQGIEDVYVYIDNIIIVHRDEDMAKAEEKIRTVLQRLISMNLAIRLEKCELFAESSRILGYIVSSAGISPDPEKTAVLTNSSLPKTEKEMKSILGAINFQRMFSPRFAQMTAPFEKMETDGNRLVWTSKLEELYWELLEFVERKMLLTPYDDSKELVLVCDASDVAMGYWLGQFHDNTLRPIMCGSRKFSPSQRKWAPTTKELHAIIAGANHFRDWLLGRHFTILSDHKPLSGVLEDKARRNTLWVRWAGELQQYDFSFQHIAGKDNYLADFLSRFVHTEEISASVSIDPVGIAEVNLAIGPLAADECSMVSVSVNGEVKSMLSKDRVDLIKRAHLSTGHAGNLAIWRHIREAGFDWRTIYADIRKVTETCEECLHFNNSVRLHHQAKSVEAEEPMDAIQFDLKGPLPMSNEGFEHVLSVVDVFSGFCFLRPMKTKSTTEVITHLNKIFDDFGPVNQIQCDNGFSNEELKQLCNKMNANQPTSAPYHPQTNGMVESLNRKIGELINKYCSSDYPNWPASLGKIQNQLNRRSLERFKGKSPQWIMFGGRPFNLWVEKDGLIVQENLTEKEIQNIEHHKIDQIQSFQTEVLPALQLSLKEARSSQNERLDSKRGVVDTLQPNQIVMYQNFSRSGKFNGEKWLGPVKILERVKNGAYRLGYAGGEIVPGLFSIEFLKLINDEQIKPIQLIKSEITLVLDKQELEGAMSYLVALSDKSKIWIQEKDIPKHLISDYNNSQPGEEDNSEDFVPEIISNSKSKKHKDHNEVSKHSPEIRKSGRVRKLVSESEHRKDVVYYKNQKR